MGLKYPSNKVNNSNEFSSNVNMPMYANMHTYTSIFKQDAIALSTQSSYCLQTNIYSNISKLSEKSTDLSDEATYGKLINTTSITPLSNTDMAINSQILDENNNSRFYENISSHSTSIKMSKSSSSSTHIYINFDHQEDIPPIIPTSNNQQEDIHYSPLYPIEKKQADIETRSKTSTIKTVKKFGVNMVPNCNDKSVSCHTKIPPTITQIHPSFRQRRTLHHSKRRHRRRSSTPFRATMNFNAMRRQQQHSNLNANVHRPMIKHDQQMKSVSNQLYNEIQQPILSDNQSLNSVYSEKDVQVIEYPIQFHGALQHQILAWYPTVTYNEEELIPQVPENEELNQKDEIIDKEEEEVFSHDTFEDSPLRHPSNSSCSTSTSDTSTVTSEERPVRPPPLSRRSSGIALSLDKNDVDFIHDIIQRTHGDQRVSNRITALREAYVRAAIKRNDLLKTKPVSPITQNKQKKTTITKHSCITSKVRDELERYDELPIHRRSVFDDDSDSDDDDTYSANDDHRFHHRTLPATPSTGHRILSFITTVKRQLQKSFHDIRSRILIETMAVPSNHVSRHRHIFHDPSMLSRRHISRSQTSHDMVHRNNNQHSSERFHPLHRHHLYRTHSSTSQIQSQHQHVRYPPSSEQHSSHTYRTTSRQQRLQRID